MLLYVCVANFCVQVLSVLIFIRGSLYKVLNNPSIGSIHVYCSCMYSPCKQHGSSNVVQDKFLIGTIKCISIQLIIWAFGSDSPTDIHVYLWQVMLHAPENDSSDDPEVLSRLVQRLVRCYTEHFCYKGTRTQSSIKHLTTNTYYMWQNAPASAFKLNTKPSITANRMPAICLRLANISISIAHRHLLRIQQSNE